MDAVSDESGLSVFTALSSDATNQVFEASDEFTRGSDISIFADVLRGHRGEKSALIEFKEATGEISFMNMLRTPILGRFELWCLPLKNRFTIAFVPLVSQLIGIH